MKALESSLAEKGKTIQENLGFKVTEQKIRKCEEEGADLKLAVETKEKEGVP